MNRDAILVDLDATLAYHPEYADFTDETWSWTRFEELIPECHVNELLVDMLTGLVELRARWGADQQRNVPEVIILTARPYFLKNVTRDWLEEHGIDYDYLIMAGPRLYDNFEASRVNGLDGVIISQALFKVEQVKELQKKGYNFVACFEDNEVIASYLRPYIKHMYKVEFEGNDHDEG